MATGTSTGNLSPQEALGPQATLTPATEPVTENTSDDTSFRRLAGSHRRETHQNLQDCVLTFACTLLTIAVFCATPRAAGTKILDYWPTILLYPTLIVTCCAQQHLYRRIRWQDSVEDAYLIAKGVIIASMLLVGIRYIFAAPPFSRTLLFSIGVTNITALILWRNASRLRYEHLVRQGRAGTHILIVGAGAMGTALAEYFETNRHLGYVFKGFVDYDPDMHPMTKGTLSDLPRIAREEFVDEVFVTLPTKSTLAKEAVLKAREMCLDVTVVPELYDDMGVQAPLEYIGTIPIVELHREPIPAVGLFAKRLIDVICSVIALLLAAPLMLLLALVIYIDSRGPIIYTSDRVGKKGRTFRFYKFRSMVMDADIQRSDLLDQNERDDILFKMENDPRVTRVGRFLRKYSLDELPQIFNVLKGEMSLVGPRPPLVTEYRSYRAEHRRRLDVVPGMTGLWQVSGRQDPSFEYYVSQDLKYIENWSLLLDGKILMKTIPAVLRGTGN